MLRIKQLRLENKLTQKELANKIGTTDKNIWAYENNIAYPPIEILSKLADLFKISVDYLIGRTNEIDVIKTDLAPMEENILTLFRSLNKQDQFKALGYLQALAS